MKKEDECIPMYLSDVEHQEEKAYYNVHATRCNAEHYNRTVEEELKKFVSANQEDYDIKLLKLLLAYRLPLH